MTIEDRVRRVLTEAVADEPPPRGAPLQAAIRRRRRRPVLIGAAAVVLVLAAVVGLVAVRGPKGRLPTADPTSGWKVYTDTARNLQLRYPPDWVLRERQPGWVRIAPPGQAAGMLDDVPPFAVGIRTPGRGYYIGEQTGVELTRGRLASGQAYVVTETDQAGIQPPPGVVASRQKTYTIEWGRHCMPGTQPRCLPQSRTAGLSAAAGTPLWDRYRSVGETIVGTIRPVTPLAPSSGDRSRPACRPDQWRLAHAGRWAYGDAAQRYVLEGGMEFLGGPSCHLRVELRLEVQKPAGRRLPLAGNPSAIVVEGDLPDDGQVVSPNTANFQDSPLNWYWAWQEWCNRGLPQASLRVTAATGARITVPGPPLADPPAEPDTGCRDRGRPSTIAPWP